MAEQIEDPRVGPELGAALRRLAPVWRPVLVYGSVVGLLAAFVLAPLLTGLLQGVLSLTGASAVVNFDLQGFIFSLRGVLLLVLWSLVISYLAVLVAGGPVLYTAGGPGLRHRSVARRVLGASGRVPGLGSVKLALLVAVLVPTLLAALSLLVGLVLLPFGSGISEQILPPGLLPRSVLAAALLASAAIGFFFYVRWVFAFHFLFLERRSLRQAIRGSAKLVRGSWWPTARVLLAHHATQLALTAVAVFVLGGLNWLVLDGLGTPGAPSYVGLVALMLVVDGAVLGALGVLDVGRLTALVTNLYVRRHADGAAALASAHELENEGDGWRIGGWKLAGMLVVALVAATVFTIPSVLEERDRMGHGPRVTAHRGSSAEAPENTLAAIRLAADDGSDYAEIDILQAKDDVLVVCHDVNLRRLTGVDRNLWELTGDELRALDVGRHFDAKFEGELMPTLEEAIQLAKQRGMRLNIELKAHGRENDRYVPDVVALVERLDFDDQCVITSLEKGLLREVRAADEKLRIGMIVSAAAGDVSSLDVDFYSAWAQVASVAFIRGARRDGREVHVWTLNENADIRRFVDRGADNIITDHPRRAREVIDTRTPEDELQAALSRLFR